MRLFYRRKGIFSQRWLHLVSQISVNVITYQLEHMRYVRLDQELLYGGTLLN